MQLTSEVDGQSMMMTLFGLAGEIADGRDFDDRELETRIDRVFETHVEALPARD